MLEGELDDWLKRGSTEGDAIRLITGGPGSGKSTFAKWLAAELSEKQRMRVLFIPLQRFRILASLKEAMASYLTETKRFQQNPLSQQGFANPSDPLLLIFDGLDELTKPGDGAMVNFGG
jgi:predicted NACHT family NTPase